MKPFAYRHARTVRHACALLAASAGRARVNAGGTDLLGLLKDEVLPEYPELLVDLKTIPGLGSFGEDRRGLKIGSLVTLSALERSPLLQERYGVLAQACREVASPQIRNVGTIGGNLCQETRCWYYRYPKHVGGPLGCLRKGNGPCLAVKGDNRHHAVLGGKRCFSACPSDAAVALVALDASILIEGTKGRRQVPAAEFHTVLGTVLAQDEIVTGIRVPRPPQGAVQSFLKFTVRKPIDFAVASVASVVGTKNGICTHARIVLGAVAPTPFRASAAEDALQGRRVDVAAADAAAEVALAAARPLSGNGHKVEIAKSLVKRALLADPLQPRSPLSRVVQVPVPLLNGSHTPLPVPVEAKEP